MIIKNSMNKLSKEARIILPPSKRSQITKSMALHKVDHLEDFTKDYSKMENPTESDSPTYLPR